MNYLRLRQQFIDHEDQIVIASLQVTSDLNDFGLTGRIRELAERYAMPLPQLVDEVATLAARVDEHLKRMGASWK